MLKPRQLKRIKRFLKKTFRKTLKKKKINILYIFLLVSFLLSFYLFLQYQNTKKLLETQKVEPLDERQELVMKISQYMILPDEIPTFASVSDVERLKDQPFFKNAQNGDKVLIYTNAQKAILYRPSIDKIIEVAAINLGDETTSSPSGNISR